VSERHAHLAPEDLLELALDESAQRAPARSPELRACGECTRALDATLSELAAIRGALAASSIEDERRAEELAESVLGRTTREDPSWRGDWHVVGRFLRERWSSSLTVRLIAASLLLHLMAVPVLAIALVLRARESRGLVVRIEAPPQDLPVVQLPVEQRRELVREPDPELPGPSTGLGDALPGLDRLARARRELIEKGAPPVKQRASVDEHLTGVAGHVAQLLSARSRRLSLGSFDSSLSEPAANAPVIERALWAELLLDDWALAGRADPRLALALGRLVDDSQAARESHPAARLAAHALERATSYGFKLPGSQPPSEPGPALDRAWFEQLERACASGPATRASDVLEFWLEWGRQHTR